MLKKAFRKYKFYISAFIFTLVLIFSGLFLFHQETADGIANITPEIYSPLPADASALPRTFSDEGSAQEYEKEDNIPLPEESFTPAAEAITETSVENETLPEKPVSFIFPTGSRAIAPFSGDNLVYSKDMGDWRFHSGVDFAAREGEKVLAAAGGTVCNVYADPFYGTTVIIDHKNGFKSYYSSLSNAGTPPVGEEILGGDVIGTADDTAVCEKSMGTHIHFALTRDGEYVNPLEYLE